MAIHEKDKTASDHGEHVSGDGKSGHIGFIGDGHGTKKYESDKSPKSREPGLIDMSNASRAVSFLNKSTERGEHAPHVGGHKNDHKTH